MAITNYRASGKTRVPFCGGDCCGTKFGRIHTHHALRPQSAAPKRKMRRYARHADKRLIRREVQSELELLWNFDTEVSDPQEIYYHEEFERSLYDDFGYDDGYDYDDGLDYYPDHYPQEKLFNAIREAFQDGVISREKYYRMVDLLNGRD